VHEEGDLLSVSVIRIGNFFGHLYFINEKVELLSLIHSKLTDIACEFQRITETNIASQIQLNGQNMILPDPLIKQIVFEKNVK